MADRLYVVLGSIALGYHVGLIGGVAETLGKISLVSVPYFFLATAFMLIWALYIECFQRRGPGQRQRGRYRLFLVPQGLLLDLGGCWPTLPLGWVGVAYGTLRRGLRCICI
jgi:hypothetical protein